MSSDDSVSSELHLTVYRRVDNLLVSANLAEDQSEARLLIAQGEVELIRQSGESKPLTDPEESIEELADGDVLQVGCRSVVHWRVDNWLVGANLAQSQSEARRLISQGAVKLIRQSGETELLTNPRGFTTEKPADGDVLQVGRRRFVRLKGIF